MVQVVYIALVFALLIFLILVSFYLLFSIGLSIKGFPFYVPTSQKKVEEILARVKPAPGDFVVDIGSGDGRIVLTAATHCDTSGLGVEINPLLWLYATLKARLKGARNVRFVRSNALDINIEKARIVFLFLMPNMILRIKKKITGELRPGTMLISHGFAIPYLSHKLVDTISDKPYPTYFYKI